MKRIKLDIETDENGNKKFIPLRVEDVPEEEIRLAKESIDKATKFIARITQVDLNKLNKKFNV